MSIPTDDSLVTKLSKAIDEHIDKATKLSTVKYSALPGRRQTAMDEFEASKSAVLRTVSDITGCPPSQATLQTKNPAQITHAQRREVRLMTKAIEEVEQAHKQDNEGEDGDMIVQHPTSDSFATTLLDRKNQLVSVFGMPDGSQRDTCWTPEHYALLDPADRGKSSVRGKKHSSLSSL